MAEKTPEEWSEEFKVDEYAPNKEITGEYDETLAAKCENGTFVGKYVRGTVDQQKLSRWYQRFIVNYATTGNPSMKGLEWPEYNNETRPIMMIDVNNVRVEYNPEKERKDIVIQMCQEEPEYRYNVNVEHGMLELINDVIK